MENHSSSSRKSSIAISAAETPTSPTGNPLSPRFQAFHRRFQSKSSMNSTSSDPPQIANPDLATTRSDAVREAKRFLLASIRDDWTYPLRESEDAGVSDWREPLGYKRREEASSDMEGDSDENYTAVGRKTGASNPYKFESPDEIGASILNRRRKKRKLFQDEMQWNAGLRNWSQQRDAWTGAVVDKPTRNRRQKRPGSNDLAASDSTEMSIDYPLSPPRSNDSIPSLSSSANSKPSTSDSHVLDPVYLPTYAPLLPASNMVRASIKPSIYPTIYSKVVVQSLAPTVPIPLPDMVNAMVQGWKMEGNWPPKSAAPPPSAINESASRRGILRFRRSQDGANATINGPGVNMGDEKGRVRKGVGAVRKAFGLRNDRESEVVLSPEEREAEAEAEAAALGMEFEDQNIEVKVYGDKWPLEPLLRPSDIRPPESKDAVEDLAS